MKNSIIFTIEGLDKLIKDFEKLEKVPMSVITPAAQKGMSIVRKDAKRKAPKKDGYLKKGIKLVGEKSRVKAKKVYRIVFDRNMNDIFRKQVKNPTVVGKRQKKRRDTAYYPISHEYGYFDRSGKYIKGKRFIRDALRTNELLVSKTMVRTLRVKLDKELKKAGLT